MQLLAQDNSKIEPFCTKVIRIYCFMPVPYDMGAHGHTYTEK